MSLFPEPVRRDIYDATVQERNFLRERLAAAEAELAKARETLDSIHDLYAEGECSCFLQPRGFACENCWLGDALGETPNEHSGLKDIPRKW